MMTQGCYPGPGSAQRQGPVTPRAPLWVLMETRQVSQSMLVLFFLSIYLREVECKTPACSHVPGMGQRAVTPECRAVPLRMRRARIGSNSQLAAGLRAPRPSHTVWDPAPAPAAPKAFLAAPCARLKQSFPARHHLIL